MTELNHEFWLAGRLKQHGADPQIEGDIGLSIRRDRIRMAILDHWLGPVVAGNRDGKPETYAQVFERLYGQPLVSATPKARSPATNSNRELTPRTSNARGHT